MTLDTPSRANIKGQILVARLDYLRERHTPEQTERLLAVLSDEDRAMLRMVARESWYPFGLLVRLDLALVERLGAGRLEFAEELGRASARHRTEWLGPHASLVSVHGFFARVADEHRRFQDFGRAVYRRTGFHSGEISFSEYPEPARVFCRTSRGYFHGVLELLTLHAGHILETTCQCDGQPSCTYVLRWRRDFDTPAAFDVRRS